MRIIKKYENISITKANFKRAIEDSKTSLKDYITKLDESYVGIGKKYFYTHKDEKAVDDFLEKIEPKENIIDPAYEKEILALENQVSENQSNSVELKADITLINNTNVLLRCENSNLRIKLRYAETKLMKTMDFVRTLMEVPPCERN